MPDTTLAALQVAELAPALTKILALEPPPTPKGRYALARWGIACDGPAATYGKKMGALIESVALPGSIKSIATGGVSVPYTTAGIRPVWRNFAAPSLPGRVRTSTVRAVASMLF